MRKALHNAEIQKSFAQQAQKFEERTMSFTKQEYLEYTVSCIRPEKTDAVLEVAAGTCICGRALAPFVQQVICLDMTPAMLHVGKTAAEKEKHSNMTFLLGDAEELPFLENSFDVVLSRLAFHHFSNPKRCFEEMARVLKPGGKLVLIDMEAAEEKLRTAEDEIERLRDPSHVQNRSREEFLQLFREYRFSIEKENTTKIPVSLEAWMELTQTPRTTAEEITARFLKDLAGGKATGFYPYQEENSIFFCQRWILLIGRKESL